MLNKIQLIGRLGADPEIKALPNGATVANLNLATTEKWKDKTGEQKEETTWHSVSFWGKTADNVGKYLSKGALVYIEGRIKTDVYEKDGQKKYVTRVVGSEIKFLQTKQKSEIPQEHYAGTDGLPNFADDIVPF